MAKNAVIQRRDLEKALINNEIITSGTQVKEADSKKIFFISFIQPSTGSVTIKDANGVTKIITTGFNRDFQPLRFDEGFDATATATFYISYCSVTAL